MVVIHASVQHGDHGTAGVHCRVWRTVCFVLVPAINGHAEITVFIIGPLHTRKVFGAFGDDVYVIGLCECHRVQLLKLVDELSSAQGVGAHQLQAFCWTSAAAVGVCAAVQSHEGFGSGQQRRFSRPAIKARALYADNGLTGDVVAGKGV